MLSKGGETPIRTTETNVPGFSTGSLLLPVEWTVDVHSNFLSRSILRRTLEGDGVSSPVSGTSGMGCSSNTVRCEELGPPGDTLYVTELFVPREPLVSAGSADAGTLVDAAEAHRIALQAAPLSSVDGKPPQVWVSEVVGATSSGGAPSLAQRFLPSYRVFIQVVVDRVGNDEQRTAKLAEVVLEDALRRYRTPLSDLPAFQPYFTMPSAKEAATRDRLPCSWHAVRDPWLMTAAVLVKEAGTQLTVASSGPPGRCIYMMNDEGQTGDAEVAHPPLSFLGTGCPMWVPRTDHTAPMWAVGHFSLEPYRRAISLCNYLSIEAAFGHHLQQHAGDSWEWSVIETGTRSSSCHLDEGDRLEGRLRWSAAAVSATDDGGGKACASPPCVIRRSTFYMMWRKGRPTDDEGEPPRRAYVVWLHSPSVGSASCLVCCAPVICVDAPIPGEECWMDLVHPMCQDVAAACTATFPITGEWTHLCREGSGFFFRQGQLVVEVPAGDARYRHLTVLPTAAQCFTSLGAISLYTPASPSAEAFASFSAVWTLLCDGRSAAEYVEYICSEFMYATGARDLDTKTLRRLTEKDGVLQIRKKGRRDRRVDTARCGSGRPAGGWISSEEWSAWLDVGTHLRMYVCVRESGLGRLLLTQACMAAERLCAMTEGLQMDAQAETELETWIDGIMAAPLPQYPSCPPR